MKKTKHNLNAIAMGVALAMGSISAASAAPFGPAPHPSGPAAVLALQAELGPFSLDPTLDDSERTGIALVESALSLIAARTHIDPAFCTEKWYKLKVDALESDGTAKITDFDGGKVILTGFLTEASLGAQVDVSADPNASLGGAAIQDYVGDHQWSRKNNIFLDSAHWTFKHPQSGRLIPYDEHSVKDYYKRVTLDSTPIPAPLPTPINESWEFDSGIEVITKKNFPVAKWGELSWYRQQDGGDGIIAVQKILVAKNSCRIRFEATGFSPFEYSGKVHVSPFDIPLVP
jgi:hypothetical protein